jgi:D-alanyl-D-alanine carboxypeptidase (penicillin-binding protein 5/6)
MRRFFAVFLLSLLAALPAAAKLGTNAEHAVLMDGNSGQVLWQKDGYVPMPPASMSKLMTLELVFQRL